MKTLAILKHGNSNAVRKAAQASKKAPDVTLLVAQPQYSKIVPKRKAEQIDEMECEAPSTNKATTGMRKSLRLEGKPRVFYEEPTEEGKFFTEQEVAASPSLNDWMLFLN